MRRWIIFSGLFMVLAFLSIGTMPVKSLEPKIEKISVQYGTGRPFSFYYPYSYQYYNPRPRLDGDTTSYGGARSCYWLYMNGSYVYYCG